MAFYDGIVAKIKTAPPRQQMVVLGALAAVIVGFFVWFVYLPASEEIAGLGSDISKLNSQIATDRVKVRRLDVLKQENARLQARLQEVREQLPSADEITELLRQVSDYGVSSGLDFKVWRPGSRAANASGLYTEIPVQVEVRGGFHNVALFFDSISKMKRIVTLSDIVLGEPKVEKNVNQLQVVFKATTYTTLNPGAAGSVKAGKNKGAGK